jgi:penicillin-binding protein 2
MYKSAILSYLVLGVFLLLSFRLLQLQVFEHDKYKTLAKINSTRVSILRAPRGIIYDRNNQILATSKQSLSLVVYPTILRYPEEKQSVAKTLSQIIEISYEDLIEIFDKMEPTTPLPLTLDNDIKIEDAIKVFENSESLKGISVEKQATRYYPFCEVGSHFIGYVGQIDSEELKKRKSRGLRLGDIVGKTGLEKIYDEELRGSNGEERVPVDRHGRVLNLGASPKKIIKKALKGNDLFLTIDADLQKAANDALGEVAGAVVVLNPKTGEIYALVSKPGFDPNLFTKPVPSEIYSELSSKKSFLNRSISSFPPGSIWKPITSLAALHHKITNPTEQLRVSGFITMGGFRFGDWTNQVGNMDIREAISWSRDTYFYQIAKRMDPQWIADMGRDFGAGEITGIEIGGEDKGIVPDPDWKRKNLKEPWYPGNTLHYSIGQSYLLVSPLQAARMVSGIATRGKIPQLHLVKNPDKENPSKVIKLDDEAWDTVQEGMRRCVASGTGQATKFSNLNIAGKTGSAEVKGYKRSTHAWFISYAPAGINEEPEIAMAIFGEGAGHGGSICAPVARKIYEVYLLKRDQLNQKLQFDSDKQ